MCWWRWLPPQWCRDRSCFSHNRMDTLDHQRSSQREGHMELSINRLNLWALVHWVMFSEYRSASLVMYSRQEGEDKHTHRQRLMRMSLFIYRFYIILHHIFINKNIFPLFSSLDVLLGQIVLMDDFYVHVFIGLVGFEVLPQSLILLCLLPFLTDLVVVLEFSCAV